MKLINIILIAHLFFLLGFLKINANDFDFMPLKMNFNGTISSGQNILVYGDNGQFLISKDKGKTWNQKELLYKGGINQLINQNDTIFGILDIGYIVESFDNGISWEIQKVDIDSNDKFLSLVLNKNNIYIRTKNKILLYNNKLKFVTSYSDSIIKLGNNINLRINSEHSFFTSYGNNLLVRINSTYNKKDSTNFNGLLILSDNLKFKKLIDLKDSSILKCYQCELNDKAKYHEIEVIKIDESFYSLNDDFSKFKLIFPKIPSEHTYWLPNNEVNNKYKIESNHYSIINNQLIALYTKRSNISSISSPGSGDYLGNYFDYGIKKYDSLNDRFNPIGSLFIDDYFINYSLYSHTVPPFYFSKISIFFDSIFVFFGDNKNLLVSTNLGNNWQLVSYCSGSPVNIQNDNTFTFLNNYPNYTNEITRTTDGGITFLPNKLIDTISYQQQFSAITMFYQDSLGNGFITGADGTTEGNFGYTKDFGQTYKFINRDSFETQNMIIIRNLNRSNAKKLDNSYLVYDNYKLFGTYYTFKFKFDTDYNYFRFKKDSNYYVNYIFGENGEKYHLLTTSYLNKLIDQQKYEIKETNDSGKTFNVLQSIPRLAEIKQKYEHNADSLFFTTAGNDLYADSNQNKVYLYDKSSNVLQTIYSNTSRHLNNLQIMYLSKKFYIIGDEFILENYNRYDLTKWQEIKWQNGTPFFDSVLFKGNIALIKLSDSLHPLEWYKMSLKGINLDVENKDEVHLYFTTQFYAYPPFPLPAGNTVKSIINFDNSYDINKAIIGVSDIYGNIVSPKEKVTITNINSYSGELEWDCSGTANGVYFILVKHNGIVDNIPVVVGK